MIRHNNGNKSNFSASTRQLNVPLKSSVALLYGLSERIDSPSDGCSYVTRLNQFEAQAFLSTNTDYTPEQILELYVDRWQCEVTFREVRQHLGVETQRQWNRLAIARSTPILMALYSILTLIVHQLFLLDKISIRTTAWYQKKGAICFSDAIAAVREEIWKHHIFQTSTDISQICTIDKKLLHLLIQTLAYGD